MESSTGLRKKAVDEINVATVVDAAKQWTIGLDDVDLVPADLRNFQARLFREAHDAPFENAESGGAGIKFFAPLKQRLVADADAEEWFAGWMKAREVFKSSCLQRVHAVIERTDARQHHRPPLTDFLRGLHDAHIRADLQQRLMCAAQIAGAVVEQGDHREMIPVEALNC